LRCSFMFVVLAALCARRRLWNETKSKLKLNGHASAIACAARMAVHAVQ
jgi:hypothetical protein